MNVSSTRKVSSSSSPIKRTERHYAPGAEGHPFVENIDTRNNVLVRDESKKISNLEFLPLRLLCQPLQSRH